MAVAHLIVTQIRKYRRNYSLLKYVYVDVSWDIDQDEGVCIRYLSSLISITMPLQFINLTHSQKEIYMNTTNISEKNFSTNTAH